MTNRCLGVIFVLALISILSCSASAQYQSNNRSRLGIRATVFRPSSEELRGIKGTWISPTLDYQLKFDKFDRPCVTISASLFSEESGINRARMIPLTATAIKRFGDNPDVTWYAGGGVGTYSVDYQYLFDRNELVTVGSEQVLQRVTSVEDSGGTKLGFNFVGGVELSGSTFLELRYDAMPKLSTRASDVNFGGLSLSLGTRMVY